MKIIKFVDNYSNGIMGRAKVKESVDLDKLETVIKEYKQEVVDWQYDELVNVCLERAGIKQYPLEDEEEIYL